MKEIRFVLPVKAIPSQTGGKRIRVIGGKPRFFKNTRTEAYINTITLLSRRYAPEEPFAAEVGVFLQFIMPKAKARKGDDCHIIRPDLDNLAKPVLDALKGFWRDDAQINSLHLTKEYADNEPPYIGVIIQGRDKP